ncbi:MAG: Holliday junction branch migration protein RuvA [Bacteroidia bacterium]
MLHAMEGEVEAIRSRGVLLQVGGYTWEINLTAQTAARLALGQRCKLLIYIHWSDHGPTLYGFQDAEEKNLFLQLIKVPQVGPQVAMQILSWLTPAQVFQALEASDPQPLEKIKGIGKKTAQKIIVELGGKLPQRTWWSEPYQEAFHALCALGVEKNQVQKILTHLHQTEPSLHNPAEIVREALKYLHQEKT